MRMSKKAHRWIGLQNGLFYLLLLVVIGLLGFVGQQFQWQADWTQSQRNSLTEPTQALLKTLEQPLKFVAYVPDDPALQLQLKKQISKYQRVKADTSLEFVNPDLDPARAKQDNIQYNGQLAIHLGERSEVVETTDEQTLFNAIQRMSRGNERLVVFIEGHDERNPLSTESTGVSKLLETLRRNGFNSQPHHLVRSQDIPRNASFVVIASPQKDWLPGEVDVLKKYIEQGGHLLWLQDPGGLHGLQPLAALLGLQIHDGTVIDANEALQTLLGINHPAVIPIIDYGKSEIAQKLNGRQTLFPFATLVARDPQASEQQDALAWQVDEFLNTMPASWLETSGVLEGNVKFDENSNDQPGPLPIGVALTRELTATEAGGKAKTQRIVVIGDSDFMLNAFVGHGANLDLASNVFNWLSADDELLNIPAATDTKLTMSETTGYILGMLFLFLLPLSLVSAGTLIWWRRRKR